MEKESLLKCGGFPECRCLRGGDRDTWLRLILKVPYVWTPFIGASYHTDSVNMVTRNTSHPAEPCLCATIKQILIQNDSDAPSPILRRKLIHLYNNSLVSHFRQKGKEHKLGMTDVGRLYPDFDPVLAIRILKIFFSQLKRKEARI